MPSRLDNIQEYLDSIGEVGKVPGHIENISYFRTIDEALEFSSFENPDTDLIQKQNQWQELVANKQWKVFE